MTNHPAPAQPPHHQALLDDTDWASLATACGTAEAVPSALVRLLDPDPDVRSAAIGDALGEVSHQNTIYEATLPVALYLAAILNHPAVEGDLHLDTGRSPDRPTLVRLLEWLGDTAYDADDGCVAVGTHYFGEGFLAGHEPLRAFRDARPAIFSAVRPLLGHDNAAARETALIAAVPLAEHPALIAHRAELEGHALRLLATSTDRRRRDRALDAMKSWGHDTTVLENADDIAARERYARLRAERDSWAGGHT
ncbi:hypothetical protein [Streptomyces sp. NPDC005004]